MANRRGKVEALTDIFSWAPKSLWMVTAVMQLKDVVLGRKAMMNLDNVLKSRDITLPTKVHIVIVFPVVIYGFERWIMKKVEHQRTETFKLWCRRRLLRVNVDCKEINPITPKGNQHLILIGRTDVKAAAPILGHLMRRADSGKDPDAGKY